MIPRFTLAALAFGAAALAIAGLAEAKITEPVEGALLWGDVRIIEDRGGSAICGTGPGYRTDTRIEVLRNGSVVASWEKGSAGPLSVLWKTEEHENGAYVIRSLRIEATFGWPCYQWSYAWREISRVNVVVDNHFRETSLSLALPASTHWLDTGTLTATLTQPESGRLLAGRDVTFRVGSVTRTAITDAAGVARAAVPMTDLPGKVPVHVSYAGATFLGASQATGEITILPRPTRVVLTAPASGYWGEHAFVYARLADVRTGAFLAGETLALSLGSVTSDARLGTGTYAAAWLETRDVGPSINVEARFAGRLGYLPSGAGATFTVLPRPTAVTYEGDAEVVRGREAMLRVVVTDALVGSRAFGFPVADALVRFTLETVDAEALSGEDGRAAVAPTVFSSYGAHAAVATFAGLPGRAPATARFTLDVLWEFVLPDEQGTGEVRLNTITGEVQVKAFGHAFPIHAFAESNTIWSDSSFEASPPIDVAAGRRASLALSRDEFAIEATFDLSTGRYAAVARVGEAAFVLRALGEVEPPAPPAPGPVPVVPAIPPTLPRDPVPPRLPA